MIEVYYRPPSDPVRETKLAAVVTAVGGRFDYREAPEVDGSHYVCLTFEFDSIENAELATAELRTRGEHVEGPCEYG